MDAGGARLLREAGDELFHLLARHHHEVRELVDHHDDERQRLRLDAVLRRPLLLDRLPDVAVVLLDVADAFRGQRLVAFLHLADGPAQCVGRLLRFDDDRRQQVWDVVVHPELEPLGVDHDQPHIVGRRAIEDACQHAVDRDGFAGACRARDEQVRHRREVGRVRFTVNRLAERDGQLGRGSAVRLGLEHLAQRDLLAGAVRNLDADGRLAGNAVDEHRLGLHRETEIVGEPGDLRVLHAGVRLELEGGDDRAGVNLDDGSLDGELAALFLEQPRAIHELALVDLAFGLRRVE